jgi:hypothetical protein
MKHTINTGLARTNIIDKSNNNFEDLYQNTGSRIQRFLMKCNEYKPYSLDQTVRVSLVGDSIAELWQRTSFFINNILTSLYPNVTFEFRHIISGGTGARQMLGSLGDLIGWNPDLVIFMEYEAPKSDIDYCDTFLRILSERTSSEFAIIPWTLQRPAMDLIASKNISGFNTSEYAIIRQVMFSVGIRNNAEIIDWHRVPMSNLFKGINTSADYYTGAEIIHPDITKIFYEQGAETVTRHFSPLLTTITDPNGEMDFVNNSSIHTPSNIQKESILRLSEAVDSADFSDITVSGTLTTSYTKKDNTGQMLIMSTIGDYIEFKFTGVGFILSYLADIIGQIGFTIDGVVPSTLIPDYATMFWSGTVGVLLNSGKRPYKVFVNSNILDNNVNKQNFKLTITSNNNLGNIAYTLYDADNNTNYGNGNFNTDSTFAINGGELMIPNKYAGMLNYTEVSGLYLSGDYFFSVEKNRYDSISITDEDLTKYVRFTGLERKEHTLRITNLAGTVKLDSFKSLI